MKRTKVGYCISLGIFYYSLFNSPHAKDLDPDFVIICLLTISIPFTLLPMAMLISSEKFYRIAEKEDRLPDEYKIGKSIAEVEYRTNAIFLAVIISLLYLIMSWYLWK